MRVPTDGSDLDLLSLAQCLSALPYFRSLRPEHAEALAARAVRCTFSAGQMLFSHDDESAGLWIIAQGRVKVFRVSADGREHIVHLAGAGDTLNEVAALDGGPNPASCVALSAGSAFVLSGPELLSFIRAYPDLALDIILTLSARLRQLVQKVEELALVPVSGRLARFLLEQQARPALDAPEITRSTIALHLATTPESVSRALRKLAALGAITYDRTTVTIRDATLLEAIASGEGPQDSDPTPSHT